MINIDSWNRWAVISFTGGPMILGIVNIAYTYYLRRCHLDDMLKALENSRYVYIWGESLKKQGLIGTGLVIAKIAQIVVWPKSSLKIGELNDMDLHNFPVHFKRLLKIKLAIIIFGSIWIVAAYIFIKVR